MTDDSLDDVAFSNTKDGIHAKATELNIRPWTIGCSCVDCNKEFNETLDSVGNCVVCDTNYIGGVVCPKCYADPLLAKHETSISVYEKEVWNAAIEAAALCVDQANRDGPYQAIAAASVIRKLKK